MFFVMVIRFVKCIFYDICADLSAWYIYLKQSSMAAGLGSRTILAVVLDFVAG